MHNHEVQFYERETFLVDRVASFLGEALRAGDSAIVIASPDHRAAFDQRLRHDGVETHGRLISLDGRDTLACFMVEGWPDEKRFDATIGAVIAEASAGGARQVYAFGEMVALLCADGQPKAALQLELLWSQLAKRQHFSLLCAYPVDAFADEAQSDVFEAICATHSHVSPCEQYQALPANADSFHRTVASLQHKAQWLEREIVQRVAAESAMSRLAAHQEYIREDERTRIAREIHDELGGLLTGIKAYVSVALDRSERQGLPRDAQLTDAAELANAALATVRRIITDLRPSVLDQLGVWSAIEWYASQIEKQAGLTCAVSIDDDASLVELGSACSTAVFRIVQEALTNVVRHAEASRAEITVRLDGNAVTVAIVDNGKGFAPVRPAQRESWGIAGMQERARHCGAELVVAGRPARGTSVALRVPLGDGNGGP